MSDLELSGDMRALEQLASRIGQLGRLDFQARLIGEMADAVLRLVQEEFSMSCDPYGQPWAPLKRTRPGGGPLVETGKLSKSYRRRASMGSFTISTRDRKAGFHQRGTRRMVARKMLPDAGQIPPRWMAELERIADLAVRRVLAA